MAQAIREYAPHLVLAVLIGTVLAASYGAIVFAPTGSNSATPKVTWSPTSVTINFMASSGSSGPVGPVSLRCTPKTGPITLVGTTSNPSKIHLTVLPGSFTSCGPNSPGSIHLIASCVVSAAQCVGSYTAMITVRQGYQTLPVKNPLSITITVRS